MANGTVQRTNDPSGKLIDAEQVNVGGINVLRQRIELAGSTAAAIADVVNADAPIGGTGVYGLSIRVVGRVPVEYCNGPVATTVVALTNGSAVPLPASSAINRRFIQVYNQGSTPILIGGSTVGSVGGITVGGGSVSELLPMGPNAILYGIALAATASVLVLEITDS